MVLLLGFIVGGFAFVHRHKLVALPHARLPIGAATVLLLGWAASTVETWVAPEMLNIAEHAAYLTHSMLMLVWVYTLWSTSKRTTKVARK